MRFAAVMTGLISAAFLGLAAWLFEAAYRVYSSDQYATDHVGVVGNLHADGGGIFIPAVLAAAVGIFFAVFARNLWRKR